MNVYNPPPIILNDPLLRTKISGAIQRSFDYIDRMDLVRAGLLKADSRAPNGSGGIRGNSKFSRMSGCGRSQTAGGFLWCLKSAVLLSYF